MSSRYLWLMPNANCHLPPWETIRISGSQNLDILLPLQDQPGAVDLAAGAAEDADHRGAVVAQPDLGAAGPGADPLALIPVRHHEARAGDLHENELEGVQPVRPARDHPAHRVARTGDDGLARAHRPRLRAVDVAGRALIHRLEAAQAS